MRTCPCCFAENQAENVLCAKCGINLETAYAALVPSYPLGSWLASRNHKLYKRPYIRGKPWLEFGEFLMDVGYGFYERLRPEVQLIQREAEADTILRIAVSKSYEGSYGGTGQLAYRKVATITFKDTHANTIMTSPKFTGGPPPQAIRYQGTRRSDYIGDEGGGLPPVDALVKYLKSLPRL